MGWLYEKLVFWVLWMGLRLRYRIKYVGLDRLKPENLPHKGGLLFLPNHPSVLIDPAMVSLPLWRKFRPRALVTEWAYFMKGAHGFMKQIDALPVPDMYKSTNSVKVHRYEQTFKTLIDGLRNGDNFLMYPAGATKLSGKEVIGGASGTHRVLQEAPEANIILVRINGLWGSSFSRAFLGQGGSFFGTVKERVKDLLKSLIFFLPKRDVTIEFVPAPEDFPRCGSRAELNRWLEDWYNRYEQPDGSVTDVEPLKRVSYSLWSHKVFDPPSTEEVEDEDIDLDKVSDETKELVYTQLGKMAGVDPATIKPHQHVARDLALDSLDWADLVLFLEDKFEIRGVNPGDVTTVARILGIASGQVRDLETLEEDQYDIGKWDRIGGRPDVLYPEGETVGEVFLRACDRMGKQPACADGRVGMLSYKELKLRALIMAEKIRQMPGDHIGILLPASIGANILIFATQLAGKVPVMINWTVGPRHLSTVLETTNLEVVLTAWAFIDKLENTDLGPVQDKLIMMEEFALEIGLRDKLRGFVRSIRSANVLKGVLNLDEIDPDSPAVMLFTSGTESHPKGVPLSHNNLLANQRAGIKCVDLRKSDVLHAMLPPFHSFGFAITGMLPILTGVRVAFSPNPTDHLRLAYDVAKWHVTILCGAPSFLRGILKTATKEQTKNVRLVVSGAEALPADLLRLIKDLGPDVQYLEGYGITECAPVLTIIQPGKADHGVGAPPEGVDLLIVGEESHEPLALGNRGLILAKGPNVFSGYASSQHIEPPFLSVQGCDWYNTGDLGYLDDTGCLHLSGRLKRFVKIGGEMVSLSAIETALNEQANSMKWVFPKEGPALAVCCQEKGDKPQLVLFTRFDTDLQEVNGALRDAGFSNIVRISRVQKLNEIPLMGTGKIFYRRLEQQYLH